jgi:hypothetical protein
MKTRIISAFPGTGKTTYHKKYPDTTLDSDSSNFSWVTVDGKKIRNPDFPANYIEHIKENIGKYEFIFVSSHKEVRDALKENCLFFYLMYPYEDKKEIYLQRYKDRGNQEAFIELLDKNWDAWIRECRFEIYGCSNVKLLISHNIEPEIEHIIGSENGDA